MSTAPMTRKSPPAVKIGDRARIARREMRLTQPQFVALLQRELPSIQDKAYASWEAGTIPENVVEVSEALEAVTGYPWTWFLRGVYSNGGGDDPRGIRSFVSPLSDSNRRPPLYKIDGSQRESADINEWRERLRPRPVEDKPDEKAA